MWSGVERSGLFLGMVNQPRKGRVEKEKYRVEGLGIRVKELGIRDLQFGKTT